MGRRLVGVYQVQHSLPVLQRCQRGEEEEENEGELKLAKQRVRTVPVVLHKQVRQPCIRAQVICSHLPYRERARGKRRCATREAAPVRRSCPQYDGLQWAQNSGSALRARRTEPAGPARLCKICPRRLARHARPEASQHAPAPRRQHAAPAAATPRSPPLDTGQAPSQSHHRRRAPLGWARQLAG